MTAISGLTDKVEVFDGVASIPCGDMLLVLWQRPARRERIRQTTVWVDRMLETQMLSKSIVVCQFLLSSASPPDWEGRSIAKVEALRLAPFIRRAVMVPLGTSVFKDLVRGILRMAVRIAGHANLLKIASSEEDAIQVMLQVATEASPTKEKLQTATLALYTALSLEKLAPRF